MIRDIAYVPIRNRQTVTRLSLRTWSFFNIAVEFDRHETQPGMMDIKSYSDETQTFQKRSVNKSDILSSNNMNYNDK